MLSQLFGVSEPVLFGLLIRWNLKTSAMCLVYIRFRRSNFSYFFHIQSNSYGLAVIPSFLMYIYSAHQLVIYLLVALFICRCMLCINQSICNSARGFDFR